ncbi:MAG: class II aldolase/adducin family protein [Rugosibacter sp.]|nr:class II aldolase/adducin family protein [Rugosibacter sp.]
MENLNQEICQLAESVLATAGELIAHDLNRGSAGNVSVRYADGCIITPTGIEHQDCTPDDMVKVGIKVGAGETAGVPDSPLNRRKPSSELRFHRDIYAAFPDAGAIIHAHPPFATALACQQLSIPPFHYMIARFGGMDVRCAEYATFGTQALSDAMLIALQDRSACLMAHHGMVVYGRDLKHALALAVELETLCEQYWRVLQLGEPKLLTAAQMDEVIAKFAGYGQQDGDAGA